MTVDSIQREIPLVPLYVRGTEPLVPARMINEWVYSPRLAYLEWVENEWAESADTAGGRRVHARVDNGRWLQLSVFQCCLTTRCRAEMGACLEEIIKYNEYHVLILDLGPADQAKPLVESLGKTHEKVVRQAIVV